MAKAGHLIIYTEIEPGAAPRKSKMNMSYARREHELQKLIKLKPRMLAKTFMNMLR
jgi:hypothetical protein